jgi:hypothetical protein
MINLNFLGQNELPQDLLQQSGQLVGIYGSS